MPSSSRISVWVRAASSSRRCQSALLRARRDTSKPEYDAGAPESHLADQMLESVAVIGLSAGQTEVGINRVNPLDRPAECDGSIAQCVLTLAALGVLEDLPQR